MKLLKRILLALDFSEYSGKVEDSAIEIAKVFQSKILPIHVLPEHIKDVKAKLFLKDATKTRLKQITEKIRSEGVEVSEPMLEFGSPHEAIVRAALRTNANLIMCGSGSAHNIEKFQLGTTATRIIQKSEIPVLVLKKDLLLNVQNIICPVDFSDASKRALKNAITLAHRFKAELIILTVCEMNETNWLKSILEKNQDQEKKYSNHKVSFQKFLDGFNLSGLKCTKEIRKGKPAEEILNTISEKMVDLLVMGTVGKSGLNRLIMGNITEKVIREVPCSFMTLKSENVITLELPKDIQTTTKYYQSAMQLMEDGFFEEAIAHLKACLNINNMYLPAYFGIAKIYNKINLPDKAKIYRDSGIEVMNTMWQARIEEDVRNLRAS
ncbi:MAG: universal stress protein [Bacteroidota bacterium]